jgi:excisionase family DNA binding protein
MSDTASPRSIGLLTASQVAERLNVSRSYTYRLLRSKRLPVVKIGSHLPRVTQSDLAKFIASRRESK